MEKKKASRELVQKVMEHKSGAKTPDVALARTMALLFDVDPKRYDGKPKEEFVGITLKHQRTYYPHDTKVKYI